MNVLVIVTICFIQVVYGFPDGAPVDACVKPKPNQPYHGQAEPQPINTLPYSVVASASQYAPGQEITVRIQGNIFKGFFIQARDAATNQWIGEFANTPNTKPHPECSSITHADPKDKEQATLIWRAPADIPHGQVYFTGTVLRDYGTFWSGVVADVQQHL